MASLSPPISVQLTRRPLAWLDGRRHSGDRARSAALRSALDALIQQEQGSASPAGALELLGKDPTATRLRARAASKSVTVVLPRSASMR